MNDPQYADAQQLMANALNYVKAAYEYFGSYAGLAEVERILAMKRVKDYMIEAADSETAALAGYISSATINADSNFKFRFNLNTAKTTDYTVEITVADTTYTYSVSGARCEGRSYIEVELHAYDIAEILSIKITDGSTVVNGSYSLYSYYNYTVGVKGGSFAGGTSVDMFNIERAGRVMNLLDAMVDYAGAAKAYNANN